MKYLEPGHLLTQCLERDGVAINYQTNMPVSMPDGRIALLCPSPNPNYYRGENGVYPSCKSSLYRIPKREDQICALAKTYEFMCFLLTLGEVQAYLYHNLWYDPWAIAQHYEFATPMIDLTHEIAVAAFFAMLSGRKISLMQRSTMQDAISAPKVGGIVRLTRFIVRGTFLIELIGMIVMLPTFCGNFGIKGIWMAAFHSISAFCNAGFDILGTAENKYPSLTGYIGEPTINIAIMLLIIVGGIGFLTWDDICTNKWHFKKYRMQSKVILVTTAILIIAPAVFFFFCDFTGLPLAERILASLFQSVTPRTAGFNTADLPAMTGSSKAIMILLMLVGGSPGSTAGGMKTTTLAVLILSAFSVCRKKDDAEVCGRRIDGSAVKNAAAVAVMYFLLFFVGGIVISTAEGLPLSTCLYETASAVGTVGLTLGITPQLGVLSQLILIVLMYLGRVGGLTLIYAAVSNKNQSGAKLPLEKITVG